jgi:hypothetical protein
VPGRTIAPRDPLGICGPVGGWSLWRPIVARTRSLSPAAPTKRPES